MSVTSASWFTLDGTGGPGILPATGITFNVPASNEPTSTPTASQVGYTILGTSSSGTAINVPTNALTTVRELTLTTGVWQLNAFCSVEALGGAVALTKFQVILEDLAGEPFVQQIFQQGLGVNIAAGEYYGLPISMVHAVNVESDVLFRVQAVFTGAGTLSVPQTAAPQVYLSATRLA